MSEIRVGRIRFYNIALWMLIILGYLARLFLAGYMPVWRDEAFSFWTASRGIFAILSAPPDYAHPPGYYVFLSILHPLTNNLVVIRLVSLTHYLISNLLLWRLGIMRSKLYALVLMTVYALSGYFIVIDWQIRSYTWTFCLILISIWLRKNRSRYMFSRYIFLFVALHTLGLYIDYSFWWYCLGIFIHEIGLAIYKNYKKAHLIPTGNYLWCEVAGLSISFGIFWTLYPDFFKTISLARDGVAWAYYFIQPVIFIPYFLGTVSFSFLTLVYEFLFVLGFFTTVLKKYYLDKSVFIGGIISFVVAIFVTLYSSPLFHVRHLILVGIIYLFVISEVLYQTSSRLIKWVVVIVLLLGGINTLLLLISDPSKLFIKPYPWRNVVSRYTHLNSDRVYVIDNYVNNPKALTPFDVWPLEYTLQGRDALLGVKHSYEHNSYNHKDCQLVLAPLYNCSRY